MQLYFLCLSFLVIDLVPVIGQHLDVHSWVPLASESSRETCHNFTQQVDVDLRQCVLQVLKNEDWCVKNRHSSNITRLKMFSECFVPVVTSKLVVCAESTRLKDSFNSVHNVTCFIENLVCVQQEKDVKLLLQKCDDSKAASTKERNECALRDLMKGALLVVKNKTDDLSLKFSREFSCKGSNSLNKLQENFVVQSAAPSPIPTESGVSNIVDDLNPCNDWEQKKSSDNNSNPFVEESSETVMISDMLKEIVDELNPCNESLRPIPSSGFTIASCLIILVLMGLFLAIKGVAKASFTLQSGWRACAPKTGDKLATSRTALLVNDRPRRYTEHVIQFPPKRVLELKVQYRQLEPTRTPYSQYKITKSEVLNI